MYNSLQITKIGMLLVGSAREHQPSCDNCYGGQIMAGSGYPGRPWPVETTQVSRGIQDGQGTDTIQGKCVCTSSRNVTSLGIVDCSLT